LGGAQIDPYGNLNSTVIGPHHAPKVRLPGSGGANDVGSLCWHTIVIIRHGKRSFVPRVDFCTTPGYLTGPGAREEAGLPPGTGPLYVVSTLALMGFDDRTKRMMLLATQPGVSIEQVVEETGFDLIIPDDVEENPAPLPEELRILREEVDRQRLYI
jgi:glutaconate CoA-transferase subunit B